MQETIAAIWAKAAEFDPGSDPKLERAFIQQQRTVLARLIDAYLDADDVPRADLLRRYLGRSSRGHFWTSHYGKRTAFWRTYEMTDLRVDEKFDETLQAFFERLFTVEYIK